MNTLAQGPYEWIRTIVDIAIVAFLLYRGLLIIKGTRASPVLGGLTLFVVAYFISTFLGLLTLAWLLNKVLGSIILVIVVVFQDEIRLALRKVGLQPLFPRNERSASERQLDDICIACVKLSKQKLGALIIIQREVGLSDLVKEAVLLDACINRKLLISIFGKESPLHDGAVLIEGERVKAAGCVLPLSNNPDLDPNLGTRHRAAVGISEQSDALVIVVSEETSSVSLAKDGKLIRNIDSTVLLDTVRKHLDIEVTERE
jgi:diadenylate cyclase